MLKKETKSYTCIALFNNREKKIMKLKFKRFANILKKMFRRNDIMHMCLLHKIDVEVKKP